MSHPTVIVVDDDSAVLTAVTGLMEFHLPDVRVEPFESPRLALARFGRQEASTVVSDLKMNELDGLALLRGAKALRPNVPLFCLAGMSTRPLPRRRSTWGRMTCFRSRLTVNNF
jgi:FixJ family two-component response regulator